MIGAFAAVVLAAEGNDGRFLALEDARVLGGLLSVEEVMKLGISSIKSVDGGIIPQKDYILVNELKPKVEGGAPTLYVRQVGWLDVLWEGIRRALKDAFHVRKRGKVWIPVKAIEQQ